MSRAGRLQTGFRGGGTKGAGFTPQMENSIGLNTDLEHLQNRPVTNQGMAGMKTGHGGPQRQFYDRSFFINELKKRNLMLAKEIERFKREISQIQKDHDLYSKLERKFEDLSKEVRELEGTLADYNLTFDKVRAGSKPEDMEPNVMHLRSRNRQFREQLDKIFIDRKEEESKI